MNCFIWPESHFMRNGLIIQRGIKRIIRNMALISIIIIIIYIIFPIPGGRKGRYRYTLYFCSFYLMWIELTSSDICWRPKHTSQLINLPVDDKTCHLNNVCYHNFKNYIQYEIPIHIQYACICRCITGHGLCQSYDINTV